MDRKKAKQLLEKSRMGQLTAQEQALLESWYLDWKVDDQLNLSEAEILEELNLIRSSIPYLNKRKQVISLWPRIVAAASILLILSFGGYYLLHEQRPQRIAQDLPQDILPGCNKAILTLSTGKQIILTDAKSGTIANDNNIIIKKGTDGTISYDDKATAKNNELVYNTITTPRGGQWPVVLPDGSKIMLDAASSITYPIAFTGNERKVTVTGQVYFDVVHNAKTPFRVIAKGQTIEDVGTQFNINAYDDEPATITTLIEGSVKVAFNKQNALLKPGQESVLKNGNDKFIVRKANVQNTIAWKDGLFQFDQTDLKTMMRQVSRWYDLDIVYQGNIINDEFDGQIPRNVTLLQMLKILGSNEIHYKIENNGTKRKLIITP